MTGKSKEKVFVAQPMESRTDAELQKERDFAIQELRNTYDYDGVEIEVLVPPSALPLEADDEEEEKRLLSVIKLLFSAGMAVFVKGWDQDWDCIIENAICCGYGISFIQLGEDCGNVR